MIDETGLFRCEGQQHAVELCSTSRSCYQSTDSIAVGRESRKSIGHERLDCVELVAVAQEQQ